MKVTTLSEAYAARIEFYNQSQPRDRAGMWTRGGAARGPSPDKVWAGVSAHPDRRKAPRVNHDYLDKIRTDPESAARQIYNTDLGGGYRSEVTAADFDDYDYSGGQGSQFTLAVTGNIKKGNLIVGSFVRQINLEGGTLSVYHDTLTINSAHQGSGLADRFNSHAVAEYQKMGVDNVSLEAGLTVGGYAWARQGFRYKEQDTDRVVFLNKVLKSIESSVATKLVLEPHKRKLRKEITAVRKAIEAGEDVQPIHLASIGEGYARHTSIDDDYKEYETWPGKSAFIGRTWDGVYYFDAANPVTASATSLEHGALRPAFGMSAALTEALACHTAACRPPSSGGTGGSLKSGVLPDVAASDVRFAYRPRHPDGHADPGEVVWARVPFEEDPTQGKDRPVLIVGRASNGNLVGVQLTSKTHHKGSFPVEWGSDKASHLRPERFIQVDLKNYRKEGAYIKKPVFQEIINSLAKTHGIASQELSLALSNHEFAFDPRQPRDKEGQWTTLYHGTRASNVEAIKSRGLTMPDGVVGSSIWFMLTSSKEQAEGYAVHDDGVVIEYKIPTKRIFGQEGPEDPRGDLLWPGHGHNVYGHDATAYAVRKPLPGEFIVGVHKTKKNRGMTASALTEALACHDASCRPPTSGGTGGSSKKSTVGFSGQSPTRTGRIRPTQRIKKLDSATLDELGWPEGGSTKSRAEAFIKSWFDPELPDGHTVKVKVVKLSDSQWSVEGRILNKHGRSVGDFERDIDFDKQMVQKSVGGTVVMHEGLHLEVYAQGLGIGAILNGHAVAAYKKYGVDHVQVHAGDTVGGYAWAVAGFRINEPQTDRHGAIGQFASKGDRTLDELNAGAYLTTAQVEQAKKEIGALVQASWAGKDIQPIHIASVGENTMRFKKTTDAGLEYDTWPGKEVMLRTNWFGVYYFGDPITASAFVKALEFACHDASCRPPTSGGTGGSLKLRGGVSVPAPRRSNPKCVPEPCVGESIERAGTIGRKLMHRALINSTLRGGTPPPTVTILGGGGGSGKTTVADALGLKREHESTINADDIKEKIPEYKSLVTIGDHTAAAFVHEESSIITKEAQAESRRQGIGVTLDQVGSDPVKLSAQIDSYVAAGYTDIRAVYIAVDTNVAVERAMTRGARTGRVVPKSVLEAAHREVSLNFERIASNPKIGEIQLIDNNGDKPFLIAKGGGGKPLEILNQEAYTRFLDKGGV